MEEKELSRGHMTHDRVHVTFTNQGSKEKGATATADRVLTKGCLGLIQVMVPTVSLEWKTQTEGGNPKNQKIKEEYGGQVGWLPLRDCHKATIQYSSERLPGTLIQELGWVLSCVWHL